MKLSEITFPVFQIPKLTSINRDGTSISVLFRDRETQEEEVRYIDDTSYTGASLGIRRIQIRLDGKKLFNLRDAIYTISDMIKLNRLSNRYIDNTGRVFTYSKTSFAPLIFRRITKIVRIATGGSILEVEGVPSRFKLLRNIDTTEFKYAGLLKLSPHRFILYGVYQNKEKDSWRKY